MPATPPASQGADLIQIGLAAAAAIFVLLHAIHGWKLGLPRALARLVGLGCSYLAGLWAAPLSPAALRPFVQAPDFVLSALGGIIFGGLSYLAIILLAAILFKKTGDQKSFLLRMIFGISGAAVGMATGLVIVWALLISARILGTVAQSQLHPPAWAAEEPAVAEGEQSGVNERRRPLVAGLARLKTSLDQGIVGVIADSVDPIPEEVYRILDKVGRLSADPAALRRFIEYPGAAELASHPKLRALLAHDSVARLAQKGDFAGLIKNELVIEASNDPEIAKLAREFPLEKALDFAIGIPREDESPRPAKPSHPSI